MKSIKLPDIDQINATIFNPIARKELLPFTTHDLHECMSLCSQTGTQFCSDHLYIFPQAQALCILS